MTRDDIIKMALDAGFCHDINNGIYLCAPMHIERFANLVAAAERDRMCEQFNIPKELAHEKAKSNETDQTAVLGKG